MKREIRNLSYAKRQAIYAALVCGIGIGFMLLGSVVVGTALSEKGIYVGGYVAGMGAAFLMFEAAEQLDLP